MFLGKVEYIKSLVNYEGTNVANVRKSFKEAVDDYLKLCQNEGIEPDQSFRGSFNVRVPDVTFSAKRFYTPKKKVLNLNKVVTEALEHANYT